jgi:hypothetical protein
MAYDGQLFMADDERILLARLAEYVEPYPAKKLARWFGCTEKTAENFKRGTGWPNARHWRLIVRHFGRDVLAAVFEPEIDETLARLRREERELREKLHEIEARRRQALGGLAEYQERRDPDLHRPAVAAGADLFEARP